MKFTNNSSAPQGIYDRTGSLHWLAPRQTRDIDVLTHEGEGDERRETRSFTKLRNNPLINIEGVDRPQLQSSAPSGPAPFEGLSEEQREALANWKRDQSVFEDQLASAQSELESTKNALTTAEAGMEELKNQLATVQSTNVELTSANAALQQRVEQLEFVPGHLKEITGGLTSKHKASGKYMVVQGDTEIVTDLTKAQSMEFDALTSDLERSNWVNKVVAG